MFRYPQPAINTRCSTPRWRSTGVRSKGYRGGIQGHFYGLLDATSRNTILEMPINTKRNMRLADTASAEIGTPKPNKN